MRIVAPLLIAVSALVVLPAGVAAEPDLPVVQGRRALATVNGEPVTWSDFSDALASVHQGAKDDTRRAKQDPEALLERLITAKLIVQEARNIGLDEQPEVVKAVAAFKDATLQRMLLEKAADAVKAPSPADVESIYATRVGVAKLDSVFFKSEKDGKAFVAALAAGKSFDEAAGAAAKAGTATVDRGYEVKLAEAQAEVAGAVVHLKPGRASRLLTVKNGFTVVRLIDLRVPDDPKARAESREQALDYARLKAVSAYTRKLRARYAVVDDKLLDSLDFDAAKPDLAASEKDGRVLAKVEGAAPVTVGELATAINQEFFHGAERAAKEKKLNDRKPGAFDDLLVKRLALTEAKRTGLDRSRKFTDAVRSYEEGLLFSTFVQKVIRPDVKLTAAEVRAYYDAHAADYTSPSMMRLESIAFAKREDAQNAWTKATNGADFGWLRDNAPGRLPATADVMRMNGEVYVMEEADPEIARALANAKAGDARVFAAPDGNFYVILVREVLPPKIKPYDKVKGDVAKRVINEKLKKVLDDWSTKLRAAYEVKTFVTPAQLDALVKRQFGPKA